MITPHKIRRYLRESYFLGHFPRTHQLLRPSKPRLAYFGFLGDGNVGDELVYWAAQRLFAPFLLVPIKRRSPFELRLISKLIGPRYFSGIVIGGGTLISAKPVSRDLHKLHAAGLPIFLHGTGVRHAPPNIAWPPIAASANGGVRGPLSAAMLRDSVGAPVIGDAAIALADAFASKRSNQSKVVLINLGTHADNEYPASTQVELELASFIDSIARRGFKPRFLPFHSIDIKRGQQLASRCSHLELLSIPRSVNDLATVFADACFALGERLHFVISAALSNCPFLSINYATKHRDFLSSIDCEQLGIEPSEFSCDAAFGALDSRETLPNSSLARIAELKQTQIAAAEAFSTIVQRPTAR